MKDFCVERIISNTIAVKAMEEKGWRQRFQIGVGK